MRQNFEPIGERARWRICYDLLAEREVDDTITYQEFAAVLDAGADREAIQGAVRRAGRELLETHSRVLDVIPNVGYRIVRAEEHLALARRDQVRSRRALERGHDKVFYVDLNEVKDLATRQHLQHAAVALRRTIDLMRKLVVGHAQLDERLQQFEARSERTEEEVAELRRRLEELEARRDVGELVEA